MELSSAAYGKPIDLVRGQVRSPVRLPSFHVPRGASQVGRVAVTEDAKHDPVRVAGRLSIGREYVEVRIALETEFSLRVKGGDDVGTGARDRVRTHIAESLGVGHRLAGSRCVGGEYECEGKGELGEQVGVGRREVNGDRAFAIVHLDPLSKIAAPGLRRTLVGPEDAPEEGREVDAVQPEEALDRGAEVAGVNQSAVGVAGPAAKLVPMEDEDGLYSFVNRQPFQTWAEKPAKPSDITNLMLIGTQQQIEQAFKDAGWASAAALSSDTKFETFRAMAEQRGYKEAPVSVLLLDKRPPNLVFEKLTNTFAQRHHLRVWRRPDSFHGKPVWVVAATHDTGIEFSEQNRTFIHKIDSAIDRERAKVVNDLLFTGHVRSVALVERTEVPQSGQNATGDNVTTDARMAVLALN